MTVYADVLVATNIYVTYFLLLAAGKLSGARMSRLRLALGALLGGGLACVMFLRLSAAAAAGVKIISALLLTLVAFGFESLRRYLRMTGTLLAATFAFAGIMLALKAVTQSSLIEVENLSVYFDISPIFLILATLICYCALTLYSRLSRRRLSGCECELLITVGEQSLKLKGMIDTGCSLSEPFSGLPVIIVRRLKADCLSIPSGRTRVIPYSTLGGEGLMMGFKPDSVKLEGREGGECYIGLYEGERLKDGVDVIVNPDIICE